MAGKDSGIQTGAIPNVPIDQITVHRETVDGVLNPSAGIAPVTIGTAFNPSIPDHISSIPGMAATADSCANAFKSVSNELQQAFNECRSDCVKSTEDCSRCVESSLQTAINFAAAVCSKTQDKVMSAVGQGMGQAIEFASSAGLQLDFGTPPITILPVPIEPPGHGPPITILPEPPVQLPPGPPICVPGSPLCPLPPLPHVCPDGSHWDATQNACVPDITPPPPPPPGGPPGGPPTGTNCGQTIASCTAGSSGPIMCNLPPELLQQARDMLNDQTLQNCTYDANGQINNLPCLQQVPGQPNNTFVMQTAHLPGDYVPQAYVVPCPAPPTSCGCPSPPAASPNDIKPAIAPTAGLCSPDDVVRLGDWIDHFSDPNAPEFAADAAGTIGIMTNDQILKRFGQTPKGLIGSWISSAISNVFSFMCSLADNARDFGASNSTCSPAVTKVFGTSNAMLRIIDKVTGAVPEGDLEVARMNLNYICPWKIPSTEKLNDLLNRGWIDEDQWKHSIRFNGDCHDWQDLIQKSDNPRPTISDAVTLVLRDVIDDDTYKDYLEKNAADRDEFADTFKTLRDQWPSSDETLRMATTGVFDENFVDKYQLLADADVLQSDNVKKYLKAAGVQDSLAQLRWIESRTLPSVGQVNEWLNRLRPGRTKVNDPLPGIDFTEEDAKELLKYKGIPTQFADKLLAMRRKPISFRHIAKSYIYGKMDDNDVIDAYKSMGYSDDVADALGTALIKDNAAKKNAYEGQVPEKTIRKAYTYSIVNDDVATQLLTQLGLDPDIAQQRVQEWQLERDAEETITLTKVIRRRYMRGDFSDADAHSKLVSARVDPDRIDTIVSTWREQREANTKIPAVQQLCSWFGQGFISASDYVTRLQNLGWQPQDALNIVGKCVNDKVEKDLKAAIAAAEKAARQAKQAEKDRQKKIKDALPCKPAQKPKCPVPTGT
jgi:hypothetical protein